MPLAATAERCSWPTRNWLGPKKKPENPFNQRSARSRFFDSTLIGTAAIILDHTEKGIAEKCRNGLFLGLARYRIVTIRHHKSIGGGNWVELGVGDCGVDSNENIGERRCD